MYQLLAAHANGLTDLKISHLKLGSGGGELLSHMVCTLY